MCATMCHPACRPRRQGQYSAIALSVFTSCDDFKARVYDADSGALLRTFDNPAGGGVDCIAVLVWNLFVSGGWREVVVWRPLTGYVVCRETVYDGRAFAPASATPSQFVASMGDESLHCFSLCKRNEFALACSVAGVHQDESAESLQTGVEW